MSFANAWGDSWGSSGSSETIIVDSFGLDITMEEIIFEEPAQFEVYLENQEFVVEQEEHTIVSEEQEFTLEVE